MKRAHGRLRRSSVFARGLESLEDRRLLTQIIPGPNPHFEANGYTDVSESAGTVVVNIRRFSTDLSGTASVRVRTVDLSTIAGLDYVPVDRVVTFGPNQEVAPFTVTILDDAIAEPLRKEFRVEVLNENATPLTTYWASGTVTIVDDEPASASPLSFHALGEDGLWTYNDVAGYRKINDRSPEAIVADGGRGAYLDFGSAGLWAWDELRGYRQLNTVDPQTILTSHWNDEILVDFGQGGLWTWSDENGYAQINAADPTSIVGGPDLALADFGVYGLWQWNVRAGWSQINDRSPEAVLNPDGGNDFYVDFGSAGLWTWDAAQESWSLLNAVDPETMIASSGGLVIGFGGGGLWTYHGPDQWRKLNDASPTSMTATTTALFLDYGRWGLWRFGFDGTWTRLHEAAPQAMEVAGADAVDLDYGAGGLWRWSARSGLLQLVAADAAALAYAPSRPIWHVGVYR